jgi:hypothetical protein
MALAGKQLREGHGFVGAIDPLAAELRFEGVRRLMRRARSASIRITAWASTTWPRPAASGRQYWAVPTILRAASPSPQARLYRPSQKEPFTARAWLATPKRQRALQHSAQRMIDRFGGFAERLLHRPGEAEIDNARPLGTRPPPERRSHTGQPRAAKCALTAGRSAN